MKIHLQVPENANRALRSRLTYAFRLFCAIYGHTPVADSSPITYADVTIRYRDSVLSPGQSDTPTVWLCRGICERDPQQPALPPVKYVRRGVTTLLHDKPERDGCPDWLGEIFEWVSCADEYSVEQRDCGRQPAFEQTYAGRYGINTLIPYAALAMRGLQQEICRIVPRAEENPRAPEGAGGHVVIPTHVVDYFPLGRMHTAARLVRNAISSWTTGHRRTLSLYQACQAARVACGAANDPLDQLLKLAEEESRLRISSSYYFQVRHEIQARRERRLDSSYTLHTPGVLEAIRWLQAKGMEVGVQGSMDGSLLGSVTSIDGARSLRSERSALEEQGIRVRGGSQHNLQVTLNRLIAAVENAELEYDCSIGWSTQIGFRAGACFPFPPYDFTKEAPANFLEFPLIAMDQALTGDRQQFHEVAQMIAASRRLSWGGISLLWHPAAFGTGWLPAHVGEIYLRLAGDRSRWNDSWMTAAEFLEIARGRFVEAGLLSAVAPSFAPSLAPSCAPVELPIAAPAGQRSSAAHSVALARNAVNL